MLCLLWLCVLGMVFDERFRVTSLTLDLLFSSSAGDGEFSEQWSRCFQHLPKPLDLDRLGH